MSFWFIVSEGVKPLNLELTGENSSSKELINKYFIQWLSEHNEELIRENEPLLETCQ
jgi:hypothetical protein